MKAAKIPSEYDVQAADFVALTGITITKEYIGHTRRFGDTPTAQFDILIEREGKKPWMFAFNDSIVNSYRDSGTRSHKNPTNYDILASIDVCWCDCLSGFCIEYGYDPDSVKARETWLAVQDETHALRRMFTESELELLQEIN